MTGKLRGYGPTLMPKTTASGSGAGPYVQLVREDFQSIAADSTPDAVEFDAVGGPANPPSYDSAGLVSTGTHSFASLTQAAGSAIEITAETAGLWWVAATAEMTAVVTAVGSSNGWMQILVNVNEDLIDDGYVQFDDQGSTFTLVADVDTPANLVNLADGDVVWVAVAGDNSSGDDIYAADIILTMVRLGDAI